MSITETGKKRLMKSDTANSRDNRFKERFKLVIDHIGTLEKIGSLLGMTGEQVGKWRDEKSKAPFLAIATLALETGIDPLWLAFGDCAMQKNNGYELKNVQKNEKNENLETVFLPVLNVQASAGHGVLNHDVEEISRLPFSRSYLRSFGVSPDYVHCIHARGDSMSPTIADKGLVLVNSNAQDITGGGIFSLTINGEAFIKRIQKRFDGSIILISDNKEHYPEEILTTTDMENIKIEGKVFWTEKVL